MTNTELAQALRDISESIRDGWELSTIDAGNANAAAQRIEEMERVLAMDGAPKDGTHILAVFKNNRFAVISWRDIPLSGVGWYVVIPCLGGTGVGSDSILHWPEDQPIGWFPLSAYGSTRVGGLTANNTELTKDAAP